MNGATVTMNSVLLRDTTSGFDVLFSRQVVTSKKRQAFLSFSCSQHLTHHICQMSACKVSKTLAPVHHICRFNTISRGETVLSAVRSSTSAAASEGGGDTQEDWWNANDSTVRSVPLAVGAAGGFLVVLNRTLTGVAPVADAGSSQSRADVLCLALSATLILTGLVWKSLQPKTPQIIPMDGIETRYVNPHLSSKCQQELLWSWDALSATMPCQALVIVYKNSTALQAGVANRQSGKDTVRKVDPPSLFAGSICTTVKATGRANYLANLALFPGRVELTFLPPNAQAVVVQPIGSDGVMIVASDRIRGFGPRDQSWIATVAQKLDATLEEEQLQEVSE